MLMRWMRKSAVTGLAVVGAYRMYELVRPRLQRFVEQAEVHAEGIVDAVNEVVSTPADAEVGAHVDPVRRDSMSDDPVRSDAVNDGATKRGADAGDGSSRTKSRSNRAEVTPETVPARQ